MSVTASLIAVSRSAIDDALGASAARTLTGRALTATDDPDPRLDLFLDDLAPVSHRSGSDPVGSRRIIAFACSYLLTVAQRADGPIDDASITAFGAVVQRLTRRSALVTDAEY